MSKTIRDLQTEAVFLSGLIGGADVLSDKATGLAEDDVERKMANNSLPAVLKTCAAVLTRLPRVWKNWRNPMAEQLTYRDAHEIVDEPLRRAHGLIRALYDLATESKQLGTNDPQAIMLLDLIACAEEKVGAALDAHETEFSTAVREIREMAKA